VEERHQEVHGSKEATRLEFSTPPRPVGGDQEDLHSVLALPIGCHHQQNSPTDVLVVPDGITPRTMVAKVWRHPGVKSMNMFRSHKTIPVVPHKAVAEVSKIGNL